MLLAAVEEDKEDKRQVSLLLGERLASRMLEFFISFSIVRVDSCTV